MTTENMDDGKTVAQVHAENRAKEEAARREFAAAAPARAAAAGFIPDGLEFDDAGREYLAKVRAFALRTGQVVDFEDSLEYLARVARGSAMHAPAGVTSTCRVWKDFAPASFNFALVWSDGKRGLHGGLIYHGPQAGWNPDDPAAYVDPLSVTLGGGNSAWGIHT